MAVFVVLAAEGITSVVEAPAAIGQRGVCCCWDCAAAVAYAARTRQHRGVHGPLSGQNRSLAMLPLPQRMRALFRSTPLTRGRSRPMDALGRRQNRINDRRALRFNADRAGSQVFNAAGISRPVRSESSAAERFANNAHGVCRTDKPIWYVVVRLTNSVGLLAMNLLRKRVCVVIIGLLAALTTQGCAHTSPVALDEDFEQFVLGEPEAIPPAGEAVQEHFDATFLRFIDSSRLRAMSGDDLNALFEASALAASAGGRQAIVAMESAYQELQARSGAENLHHSEMHAAYVRERRFSDARAIEGAHEKAVAERVPRLVDVVPSGHQGATVLTIPVEGDVARRVPLNLSRGSHLLVLWHPRCHFSVRALEAIRADAQLASMVQKYGVLVAPAFDKVRFRETQEWNRTNHSFPLSVAYLPEEFPFVDAWETPVFYFLEDGKVVDKVVGWPREGRVDEVRRHAARIGILEQ